MKNLLRVIIVSILLFTISSCKEELASNKYDLDTFHSIDSDELFKKIEVVILDSVPIHPISAIINMDYHNGLFYLQDWFRTSLLVYNEAGEYVRSIGTKGRGPGEFEDVRDFQINRFTGNIEILGNMVPIILIFDTQGNYITKRNIGNRMITIDKIYHITPDLTAWLSRVDDYQVVVYSEKLNKIVYEYFIGIDRAFVGLLNYRKPFSHYKNKTYFFDTYNNLILEFNVEDLKFKNLISLDFGDYNFNKVMLPHPDKFNALNFNQQKEILGNISKLPLELDVYIDTDKFTLLRKYYYYILIQKQDNNTIEFNSLNDKKLWTSGLNQEFAFHCFPLINFDNYLTESMIGAEEYHKLQKLSLEEKNKEIYAIIKYWFK